VSFRVSNNNTERAIKSNRCHHCGLEDCRTWGNRCGVLEEREAVLNATQTTREINVDRLTVHLQKSILLETIFGLEIDSFRDRGSISFLSRRALEP